MIASAAHGSQPYLRPAETVRGEETAEPSDTGAGFFSFIILARWRRSAIRSSAVWYRSFFSFERHLPAILSSSGGTPVRTAVRGSESSLRIE